MKKLLLIDGSSLLHRAFYALPLLANRHGQYTNGVHGFMMMLNRLVKEQNPDNIIVCFDKSRITFRNDLFADYKGTRKETPTELRGQFEILKDVLTAAHIDWQEQEGFEADDLLGTLATFGERDGFSVQIFSGDKDVLQLIDDNIFVFMTRRGISDIEVWDKTAFIEKYAVAPSRMIDIKGLMGDSSDNIPGVPGIGEKTALKLLAEFGSLDAIYENIENIKQVKLREKLVDNQKLAFLSRELATINRNAPVDADWQNSIYNIDANDDQLRAIYEQLEMKQLLRGLGNKTNISKADTAENKVKNDSEVNFSAYSSLAEVMAAAVEEKSCSIYCTWQGSPVKGDINCLAISAGQQTCFIDLSLDKSQLPNIKPLLEDENIDKILAYAKEILLLLQNYQIKLAGVAEDVIIAAYLLDAAAGSYDIPDLLAKNGIDMPQLADAPAVYAAALADLSSALNEKLAQNGMEKLYYGLELPLYSVLGGMESAGIRVEEQKLAKMSQTLAASAADYQEKIYALAGHDFNLNSPKQLGVVLFEEMAIPPIKKTKTGYSTDVEVLEQLANDYPIASLLLDYRLVTKLKSTYTDGLRSLINPQTGKLHTSFKQTVTATGRLSSVEPNLQNIPVRHELGRRVREVFVADKPGDLLLSADYNQIELRVLAHISGDEKFINAFIVGEDIHTRTAAEVFGVSPEQVDKNMRRNAKAVNFGIVYGISDYGLSRDLGISRREAAEYIEKYFARYPLVGEYQKKTIAAAKLNGYVTTICGRRRLLPELSSRNYNLRSFAERMAINTPIQGSAADIIKIAMINIAAEMEEYGLKSKMLLQVHDELMFNMVAEEKNILPQLVKKHMEQAIILDVPLTVDMKIGYDWYNMEKLSI